MFTNNLVFTLLILGVLGIMLNKIRTWRDTHPQQRLGIILVMAACAICLVIAAIDPPWAGRWIMGGLLVSLVAFQYLYSKSIKRHTKTLDLFAQETGMAAVLNAEQEKTNPLLSDLLKWMQKDLYHWKVRGGYPALVSKKGDWTLVIRVPYAVDFDVNAPDYTVFAYINRMSLNTVTAAHWPLKKEEHPTKSFPTGDKEFDSKFYLTGANQAMDDALWVFDETVREYLKSLPELPGWIRVERFGVYYYMPGAVTSMEQIDFGIKLVEIMGEAMSKSQDG